MRKNGIREMGANMLHVLALKLVYCHGKSRAERKLPPPEGKWDVQLVTIQDDPRQQDIVALASAKDYFSLNHIGKRRRIILEPLARPCALLRFQSIMMGMPALNCTLWGGQPEGVKECISRGRC